MTRFQPGDRVRALAHTRPEELRGLTGTVVDQDDVHPKCPGYNVVFPEVNPYPFWCEHRELETLT